MAPLSFENTVRRRIYKKMGGGGSVTLGNGIYLIHADSDPRPTWSMLMGCSLHALERPLEPRLRPQETPLCCQGVQQLGGEAEATPLRRRPSLSGPVCVFSLSCGGPFAAPRGGPNQRA